MREPLQTSLGELFESKDMQIIIVGSLKKKKKNPSKIRRFMVVIMSHPTIWKREFCTISTEDLT